MGLQQPAAGATEGRSTASSRPRSGSPGIRSSAVRFNNGGSGSFVSADGLVMTNHHVAADTLQKISTAEHDYYSTGFLAEGRDAEIKAPDLELNVTVAIEDVTDRVNAAVEPRAWPTPRPPRPAARRWPPSSRRRPRRTACATTWSRSTRGGKYHLYTYKKYTDVRLVFAPEFDIAFFGGDEDNFEYPRYCLDVAFFRAYEDGKPAKPEHYPELERRRLEGGRPRLRRRPPRPHEPAEHAGPPRILPRHRLPVPARPDPRPRGVPARLQQARRGAGPPGQGGPVRLPEQPQGPPRRL